jgi:N-acetylmuramic acid 6-phosphate etherase
MLITNASYEEAVEYLTKSDYHIKSAIVMLKAGVSLNEAKTRLKRADGFVRAAIEGKEYQIL